MALISPQILSQESSRTKPAGVNIDSSLGGVYANPNFNPDLNAMDVSSQLQGLGDQQSALATQFQNSIPSLAATFADQTAQINKKNLADSIDNNRTSYNSHGLLYGGGLQGANAASQQGAAAKQAQDVANENTKLQSTSNDLNTHALSTKNAIAGEQGQIDTAKQKYVDDYMNIALQNKASDISAIGGVAKFVGAGGGQVAGGLLKNSGGNDNSLNTNQIGSKGNDFGSPQNTSGGLGSFSNYA